MPNLQIVIALLLFSLHILASSATTTDTIAAGQALSIHDKPVSNNGRYALGFFEAGSNKASQNTSNWYLGIWFHSIPKFTVGWVANRDDPMKNPSSLELRISQDGNLVVTTRSSTDSILWSTHRAKMKGNNTIVVLLNNANLILRNASNSSDVFWQSFDHPTDTFFPGAKLGWDKVTGLNRRLVSNKNSISPASGLYSHEVDPSGVNQFVLVAPLNSSKPYWSSGPWKSSFPMSYTTKR